MEEMKGITCCGDCAYYNWNKHKCSRFCKDEGAATDHFYKDCPLPDVQPVNQWILCSERLPDKKGWYLATVKVNCNLEYIDVRMVVLKKANKAGKKKWYRQGQGNEVLAWMPLPEPYKE